MISNNNNKYSQKNGVQHIFILLMLLSLTHCATTIPVLIPKFPKAKGHQLRQVLDGQRNVAVLAIKISSEVAKKLDSQSTNAWNVGIEASVSQNLSELGYYKIIDISSRKERLKELAYTQSGLTEESLEIGRDLQVNNFFLIRLPKPPKIECRIEEVENYATTALAITARAVINPNHAGSVNTGRPTGVLYVSLFIEGRLSNVETGQSVSHFYTKTLRLPSTGGNRACTSSYKALEKLIPIAGRKLAKELSPKFLRLSVSLFSKSQDLSGNMKRIVEKHLIAGVKWAKNNDMEEAHIEWEAALKKSNQTSGGAYWNLAVYHWHTGDFEQADEYFTVIKRKKWQLLDHKKRRTISLFNKEKRASGIR